MKTLIIYKSEHHMNTEKIARAMGKVLDATLIDPENVTNDVLVKYDLIGFGSGIYNGKFHPDLIKFIEKFPSVDGKKAFIFATSGIREIPLFNSFIKRLANKLKEKGFSLIGTFNCRGWDTNWILKYIGGLSKGRPNEKDIEDAKKFAEKLK